MREVVFEFVLSDMLNSVSEHTSLRRFGNQITLSGRQPNACGSRTASFTVKRLQIAGLLLIRHWRWRVTLPFSRFDFVRRFFFF
ncbi:hypothetical protein CLV75_1559 [Ruegeria conchae]|uniref:Uncharacterized protein n=1 Tax=Ruegeria conchae TaxID=981384 RepID=A0A497ZSJ0_9RHOB|nr:hypothetical protein CLV75_1559 [Ruegeria conchae]